MGWPLNDIIVHIGEDKAVEFIERDTDRRIIPLIKLMTKGEHGVGTLDNEVKLRDGSSTRVTPGLNPWHMERYVKSVGMNSFPGESVTNCPVVGAEGGKFLIGHVMNPANL